MNTPIWTGLKGGFEKKLKGITSKKLAAEYRKWMRERWKHLYVVVWDAQNESVNDSTTKAIQLSLSYDLSNRPWDNGWTVPVSDCDAIEADPYIESKYMTTQVSGKKGFLKELLLHPQQPRNYPKEHSPSPDGKNYNNPVIINEYGWL